MTFLQAPPRPGSSRSCAILQQSERVRDPLTTLLNRVFSLLEDYSIDPEFAGPDDLSEEELRQTVVRLVQQAERHTRSNTKQ